MSLSLCGNLCHQTSLQRFGSIKGMQSESQTGMRRVTQLPITEEENYLTVATKLYKFWILSSSTLVPFSTIFLRGGLSQTRDIKGWVNFQLQLGRTISLLSRLNCTNFGPTRPFSTIFSRGGLTQTRGIKGWVNVQFRAMRTILQWPHLNWTTLPKLVDEQNLKFELFSTEKRRENIFQMIFNLRDQIFSAFSSYVRSQIDFWPWNY